jgi:hypothetical protein
VSTTEELLERKSSGSGLESREYGRRDSPRWPRGTLYTLKLALTPPTSGGRSVDIVRSRTQATEFFVCFLVLREHFVMQPRRTDNYNLPLFYSVKCSLYAQCNSPKATSPYRYLPSDISNKVLSPNSFIHDCVLD